MKTNLKKILGYLLILVGIIILAVVGYMNTPQSQTPIIFSTKNLLDDVWINYKKNYIEASSGRTYDPDQNNITTSEGQSYTMFRAVWLDDKETFDKSYDFAKNNLKRSDDHLFAWLYGELPNGKYGILTARNGQNSASDADTDIALSLIFASKRWGDQKYTDDAKLIINDIWNKEVVKIGDKYYMGADNFESQAAGKAVINPSYIAPYAYRIFSIVDREHNWNALASDSYELLNKATEISLDKKSSANLPPEWIEMDKNTGNIRASASVNLSTNYGFNAFRTPWRIALDWKWYDAPEAEEYLNRLGFLKNEWNEKGYLASTYSHDGQVINENEAPAMYGGSIGYFIVSDNSDAKKVYDSKLLYLYDSDKNEWKEKLSYYDDNWAWFGIALYNDLLPDLSR